MKLETCRLCPHTTKRLHGPTGNLLTWCKKTDKACFKIEICPLIGEKK